MTLAIIPARLDSKRFPNKPMHKIGNKTMLRMVYETAAKVFDRVVIATPDIEIYNHAISFTESYITLRNNLNGSEACAEVARHFHNDMIVNIQVDKPFISESALEKAVNFTGYMGTLVYPIKKRDIDNPNRVKAIIENDYATHYTRKPTTTEWQSGGVYMYSRNFLQHYCSLPATEKESLEQTRVLNNGYDIKAIPINEKLISIDVPADLTIHLNSMFVICT